MVVQFCLGWINLRRQTAVVCMFRFHDKMAAGSGLGGDYRLAGQTRGGLLGTVNYATGCPTLDCPTHNGGKD